MAEKHPIRDSDNEIIIGLNNVIENYHERFSKHKEIIEEKDTQIKELQATVRQLALLIGK